MYRQLLEKSPLLVLPLFALLVFVAVFLAIVLRTYARKHEAYAREASLPLADDDSPGGAEPTRDLAA